MNAFEALKHLRVKGDNPTLPIPKAWNSECPLFRYQRVGASHLAGLKRFVLGDSTGSGKTPTALYSWGLLRDRQTMGLVVVTTTSAVSQWESEVQRFLPGVPVYRAVGSPEEREKIYQQWHQGFQEKPVLILSWGVLLKDGEKLIPYFHGKPEQIWLILDEVQKCRNPKAQIYQLMQSILQEVSRAHGLTATLVKNKAHDAFYIFNLLVPGAMSRNEFERKYCNFVKRRVPMRTGKGGGTRFIQVKKLASYHHLDHFTKFFENFYLSRADSEMDLERPALQLIRRSAEMSSLHRKIYKTVESGFFVKSEEAENNIKAAQYALAQSQIAANNPEHFGVCISMSSDFEDGQDISQAQERDDYDKIVKESSKLNLLLDLLENELEDEPVIIYSSFATTIRHLQYHLRKYNPVVIEGQTNAKDRAKAQADFQEGRTNIILLTDAGGEALNLQRAGHVLFYSLPWTPGAYVQVIGRARRFGSQRKFLGVWHLTLQDSADGMVDSVLNSKVAGFETILKNPGLIPQDGGSLPLEVFRRIRGRVVAL
jgi:SNF2 family DNA or RNA helicase